MKEYIEINKNTFPTPFSKRLNGYMQGWNDCLDSVLQHKTADVAPVVRGEWLQVKEPIGWKDIDCVMCSACEDKWIMDKEYDLDFYKEQWKYCPFCGAKMDGGNK